MSLYMRVRWYGLWDTSLFDLHLSLINRSTGMGGTHLWVANVVMSRCLAIHRTRLLQQVMSLNMKVRKVR